MTGAYAISMEGVTRPKKKLAEGGKTMVPEDVNEAKGSRRSRGRIVVRHGIPSREEFHYSQV